MIYKKGENRNYRGRKAGRRNGILMPENQGGFRKGRGTIDNILVLSHLIQRKKSRR